MSDDSGTHSVPKGIWFHITWFCPFLCSHICAAWNWMPEASWLDTPSIPVRCSCSRTLLGIFEIHHPCCWVELSLLQLVACSSGPLTCGLRYSEASGKACLKSYLLQGCTPGFQNAPFLFFSFFFFDFENILFIGTLNSFSCLWYNSVLSPHTHTNWKREEKWVQWGGGGACGLVDQGEHSRGGNAPFLMLRGNSSRILYSELETVRKQLS